MSLTKLIHTVSIKLQKSEEETFEQLNTLAEVVKEEIFPKNRLTHYNMEMETLHIILTELIRSDLASKYFAYDCEAKDSIDYVITLDDQCKYCGEVLKDSKRHITREMFKLNSNFLQLIAEYRSTQLKKYLMDEYRDNLEKLKNRTQKIVPFLGAGVSIPLNLPNWKDLLLELDKGLTDIDKKKYREIIEQGDFLKALSFLKKYSTMYRKEDVLKRGIKDLITTRYRKENDDDVK
ncbi:hypothetical protein [Lentibacillus daqui]|uniref:hypothetical protein n=1 Tax=Lentibacillus daqui TaxID=2911514 RepID=UPI0022B1D6CA|nr:hypothetical protein [Lentibacillus daqui]